MIKNVTSQVVLNAVLAAKDYVNIVTDHDPHDDDHIVPGELRRFLARLRLLHDVPFSYLVPDADLLPIESIRFFYIDRAWTDALIQGVLSVGTITTADRAQLEAVYPNIRDDVDETERTIREPNAEPRLKGSGNTITGFLMRSRLVSGWPNLHVRAYSRDDMPDDEVTDKAEADPDRLKLLRMERLAPAVLLVLIDGVPAVMHIEEPRQGIQFGVHFNFDDPPEQRTATVNVRDINNGNLLPPPTPNGDPPSVDVPFRSGAPGVLNLTKLRERLAAKALPPERTEPLQPNEYALEMLRFPFRQVFGDPENKTTSNVQFYSLDQFKVSISFKDWNTKVGEIVEKVNS